MLIETRELFCGDLGEQFTRSRGQWLVEWLKWYRPEFKPQHHQNKSKKFAGHCGSCLQSQLLGEQSLGGSGFKTSLGK
jgi:hypothetical protein